mgnify:CR=1 FL=1
MKLADRIHRIQPSATLEMTAKAASLREQGVEVYNMSVGEPDFNTPDNIISAAVEAMEQGHTKYTPGSGTIQLKKAIQKNMAKKLRNRVFRFVCCLTFFAFPLWIFAFLVLLFSENGI